MRSIYGQKQLGISAYSPCIMYGSCLALNKNKSVTFNTGLHSLITSCSGPNLTRYQTLHLSTYFKWRCWCSGPLRMWLCGTHKDSNNSSAYQSCTVKQSAVNKCNIFSFSMAEWFLLSGPNIFCHQWWWTYTAFHNRTTLVVMLSCHCHMQQCILTYKSKNNMYIPLSTLTEEIKVVTLPRV